MLSAAATAIGSVAPLDAASPLTLLPPLARVTEVADAVAVAVARQAVAEGLADPLDDEHIEKAVEAHKWRPQYRQAMHAAGLDS
jgi:malate dehydrogenase (oxaloacetate-decarboxylating)